MVFFTAEQTITWSRLHNKMKMRLAEKARAHPREPCQINFGKDFAAEEVDEKIFCNFKVLIRFEFFAVENKHRLTVVTNYGVTLTLALHITRSIPSQIKVMRVCEVKSTSKWSMDLKVSLLMVNSIMSRTTPSNVRPKICTPQHSTAQQVPNKMNKLKNNILATTLT